MSHYHNENDMKLFNEMSKLTPEEFKAWLAFTTQCPYCIEVHTKAAKLAGVRGGELSETVFLAAGLRAGGAATHGAMALRFFNQD
jgi:AhpD family alkylhydroperoxidase